MGDYTTKLNLSIADGKLPDVFRADLSQLKQLHEAGLIMDITDIFKTYASEDVQHYYDDEQLTYETGCFDGRLYGLPMLHYGLIDKFNYVWIRKDWKDQLNLPDPETMEDVLHIAKEFKENFGGYGIGEDQNLDALKRTAIAWGAAPNTWIELEDGTLGYGSVQPEMKEAVKNWAEWYKDGYFDVEFTTKNEDKVFQDMINGEMGVYPCAHWLSFNPMPDVVRNQGPEAIYEPYTIPSCTGEPVKQPIHFTNGNYVVINKNCKNPEAVFKVINLFASVNDSWDEEKDEAGKERQERLMGDGYPSILTSFFVINPNNEYRRFEDAQARVKAGLDPNDEKNTDFLKWVENKDPGAIGYFLQQGNERSTYALSKEYLDNGLYFEDAIWGAAPESVMNMGSTLDDILTEGFTKIITGVEDIDYFDTLVEQWEKAGGAKESEEVNEMYGNK